MKRKIMTAAIALLCLSVAAECSAMAQTARAIWAVNDGEKIERDETNSPHKRGNSVWDGKRIRIFGAAFILPVCLNLWMAD